MAFDNNDVVNDLDDRMNVEAPEWDVQGDISQLYTGAPPEVGFELLFILAVR